MPDIDDYEFIRVKEDDPTRCQAVNSNGQCRNKSVEGGTNCLAHGGNRQLAAIKKKSVDMYVLNQYHARLKDHADHPAIKSLNNEIGILRMTLERKLNSITDDTEMMLQSQAVSELVMKIQTVVTNCAKVEKSLGEHLDKATLMTFAGEILTVITDNIDDPEVKATIAEGIVRIADRYTA